MLSDSSLDLGAEIERRHVDVPFHILVTFDIWTRKEEEQTLVSLNWIFEHKRMRCGDAEKRREGERGIYIGSH